MGDVCDGQRRFPPSLSVERPQAGLQFNGGDIAGEQSPVDDDMKAPPISARGAPIFSPEEAAAASASSYPLARPSGWWCPGVGPARPSAPGCDLMDVVGWCDAVAVRAEERLRVAAGWCASGRLRRGRVLWVEVLRSWGTGRTCCCWV